jgi:hypothetical protein
MNIREMQAVAVSRSTRPGGTHAINENFELEVFAVHHQIRR